jgi:hypothetical protein
MAEEGQGSDGTLEPAWTRTHILTFEDGPCLRPAVEDDLQNEGQTDYQWYGDAYPYCILIEAPTSTGVSPVLASRLLNSVLSIFRRHPTLKDTLSLSPNPLISIDNQGQTVWIEEGPSRAGIFAVEKEVSDTLLTHITTIIHETWFSSALHKETGVTMGFWYTPRSPVT